MLTSSRLNIIRVLLPCEDWLIESTGEIKMKSFGWKVALLVGGVSLVLGGCNGDEETTGEGDDAVTYTASAYGTCGFNPDPSAEGYVPYADLTQEIVLGWVYDSVDKDATEASLQSNIDLQVNPVTAAGVPW